MKNFMLALSTLSLIIIVGELFIHIMQTGEQIRQNDYLIQLIENTQS